MNDEQPSLAERIRANRERREALMPQHISSARAYEVMQGADERQQRGSNEVFHPRVAEPNTAQAKAEQRRHDLINAPTADQVTQAEIDQQRRRLARAEDRPHEQTIDQERQRL